MVDFPTPPLADETAIIESTPDIFFAWDVILVSEDSELELLSEDS
jgi:hypothetical protein